MFEAGMSCCMPRSYSSVYIGSLTTFWRHVKVCQAVRLIITALRIARQHVSAHSGFARTALSQTLASRQGAPCPRKISLTLIRARSAKVALSRIVFAFQLHLQVHLSSPSQSQSYPDMHHFASHRMQAVSLWAVRQAVKPNNPQQAEGSASIMRVRRKAAGEAAGTCLQAFPHSAHLLCNPVSPLQAHGPGLHSRATLSPASAAAALARAALDLDVLRRAQQDVVLVGLGGVVVRVAAGPVVGHRVRVDGPVPVERAAGDGRAALGQRLRATRVVGCGLRMRLPAHDCLRPTMQAWRCMGTRIHSAGPALLLLLLPPALCPAMVSMCRVRIHVVHKMSALVQGCALA